VPCSKPQARLLHRPGDSAADTRKYRYSIPGCSVTDSGLSNRPTGFAPFSVSACHLRLHSPLQESKLIQSAYRIFAVVIMLSEETSFYLPSFVHIASFRLACVRQEATVRLSYRCHPTGGSTSAAMALGACLYTRHCCNWSLRQSVRFASLCR
jgi:hypothetical protein